ncbi:MAG: hypothetical protein U0X75_19180 [Acidobacteriota bacterium]
MQLVAALNSAGLLVEEVITSGTPAFPCAISYRPFAEAPFVHRASPGTMVYGDATSLGAIPCRKITDFNLRQWWCQPLSATLRHSA